jgi:hypothetical protein
VASNDVDESARHVNLEFIDLLYAVPVAVLATRVGEADPEHVSAAAWADIFLALIALTLGWVGHHNNRRRKQQDAPEPPELSEKIFTERSFWQFWSEAFIIGAYFALSTRLSLPNTHSGQLQWKAWWIVGLFGLYLLWDYLDVRIARVREQNRQTNHSTKYKNWAERATQGGIVTALFLVVFVVVRYSAPAGRYWTVPFDVTCIALLYGYRVSQQEWIRAFRAGDKRLSSWKRRLVLAGVGVFVILGFSGLLKDLFSLRREDVAITRLRPHLGPTTGGTPVAVTGRHFEPGETGFRLGNAAATNVLCQSDTQCTLVTPAGQAGVAEVVATLHGSGVESSAGAKVARFTYVQVKPKPPEREHVLVELTPYGRRVLRQRLGARCLNDDLRGRVVAGPSSAPVVLALASSNCRRLRVRVSPSIGVIYLPARAH